MENYVNYPLSDGIENDGHLVPGCTGAYPATFVDRIYDEIIPKP